MLLLKLYNWHEISKNFEKNQIRIGKSPEPQTYPEKKERKHLDHFNNNNSNNKPK